MTTSIAQIEIPTFSGVVKPVAALLLYETEQRVIGTLHPLTVSRRGQAVLGVGRPFSQRDVQDLLALLAGQHPPKTFDLLPAHLLAHGEEVLGWWRPGQVRPMWFLLNGQRFGFRVPWPSLVFVAHRQGLWCAALAQKARPQPDTALFHAPLMNIDAQGQVCFGTADIPPDHAVEHCADWEAVVTATNFSHVNHTHTLQLKEEREMGTERHFAFWQSLDGQKRFPTAALHPRQQRLQAWLERVLA